MRTQRRQFQQSRGRSLQQRAKETPAPPGPQPRAPGTPKPCAKLGGRSTATAVSTYHHPAAASRPPATGPTPRNRDGEASGRAAEGRRRPQSPGTGQSPKNGAESYSYRLGKQWNLEAILGCEEEVAMAPEIVPAGPAGLPATPDRARPGRTPGIGPPPKTAPAALYSLCPRSCFPLHHSCRPDVPQN